MIRLRQPGADEVLIKRVRDWYDPGPGVFIQSLATASFSPSMLFTGSTTGAWYDPSDFSTLFQDAAGTTPVTAVEQPVGRMLDKSGKGNHAFNPTAVGTANFPVLSARYNLLTKTEQFDDAVWSKLGLNAFGSGSVANTTATTDPLGGNTADLIQENANNTTHAIYVSGFNSSIKSTFSVYVKSAGRSKIKLQLDNIAGNGVVFDVVAVTATPDSGYTEYSITSVGNGWCRCSITTSSVNAAVSVYLYTTSITYQGDGTSGIYIWGADLRPTNDALNQPAYQRVNTSTDYDTVGFKPYLRFNGTNQWLQTNSIDFTYGDKMFVCAGVRKLSDATTQMLFETSAASTSYNGAFCLTNKVISTNDYWFNSRGTVDRGASSNIAVAPITNVISGIGDISGDQSIIRINGTQAATNTGDQGTGNYGNYPLYMGARAGTSLWANIRFYGAVVAGKQASADEITNTETFINQKTGAY